MASLIERSEQVNMGSPDKAERQRWWGERWVVEKSEFEGVLNKMRVIQTKRAKRELAEFKKKFYAGTPPKEGVQQREVLTFEEILAMDSDKSEAGTSGRLNGMTNVKGRSPRRIKSNG